MEAECTSLSWEFCTHQEDGMEEIKHALLYTTLELETTIMSAKEEILRRECEIMNLRELLNRAIKEKDEVEAKCGKLMFENLFLLDQHKNQEHEVTPQSDSDSCKIFACSDSDDNTIQSSQTEPIMGETLLSKELPPTVWKNACHNEKPLLSQELRPTVWKNACENEKPSLSQELPPAVWKNACEKPLPQKGKLLQAVIEAGPLLQNLLLAGPLPHWQHPPPLVDSGDIPPVIISPRPSHPPAQSSPIDIRKRSHSFLSDISQHSHKHQKVVQ
ncbi:unnamed protein product [Citrullus colocynthis]|uniref:Uncharacterized protein n=1 Tax=Citrullus colocynthis TaxID=252529 RepID=A0ABP0Y3U5_9ROSI